MRKIADFIITGLFVLVLILFENRNKDCQVEWMGLWNEVL